MVDNCGEPALRELRQLALGEEAFEQQDAPRVVSLAQVDRRIGFDQRQAVRILQRGQHAREAVPVRVGLDHRQHLRVGRLRAHQREIGAQRGEVDLGEERSGHSPERIVLRHRADLAAPPLRVEARTRSATDAFMV